MGQRAYLLSDVRYSDWEPLAADGASQAGTASGVSAFPRVIQIERPHDDYRLDLQVTKLMLNEDIPAERFKLEQPVGSELVRVGEDGGGETAMMGELIVRNLLHRPLRTLIGVLAVAVEVALIVLIVGLTSGMLAETAKRIEGIGADIMVQPPAASFLIGITGAPMPIKIGEKLAELKYVQAVAPDSLAIQFPRRRGRGLRDRSGKLPRGVWRICISRKDTTWRVRTIFWLMIWRQLRNTSRSATLINC